MTNLVIFHEEREILERDVYFGITTLLAVLLEGLLATGKGKPSIC